MTSQFSDETKLIIKYSYSVAWPTACCNNWSNLELLGFMSAKKKIEIQKPLVTIHFIQSEEPLF